jgi:hypothetical protein
MVRAEFKILPRAGGSFDVQMTTARGQIRLVPDSRSESEAQAWIIQIERQIAEITPRLPFASS